MEHHISLWQLSRELGAYLDLIRWLVTFNKVPVIDGPRGRLIRAEDRQLVSDLLSTYRNRLRVTKVPGARKPRNVAPVGGRLPRPVDSDPVT